VVVGGCFLVLDLGDADRERRGASEVMRGIEAVRKNAGSYARLSPSLPW